MSTPSAKTDYSLLYYKDELGTRICPCVELIAFTDARLIDGPHAGLLNFYETFRRRFGASIQWYRTNTDGHFKKLKPGKLDMVPFWFSDERSKVENLLGVELKPGEQAKDMQVPSFKFFCDQALEQPSGAFRMALPLSQGFETLEVMLPLIRETLKDFPLVSGYVGYSVYWDILDFRFERDVFLQHMPRMHMRHPGIGLAYPTYLSMCATDGGLVGVSWITLLGPKPLFELGGLAQLGAQLAGSSIEVQPLDCQSGGAIVIAGSRPLVGDLEEGDDLPLYKEVGLALRKARYPGEFYKKGFAEDVAQKWFLRFFGEQ